MHRIEARLHSTTDYEKIMSLQTHPDVEPYNLQKKHRFIEHFHNYLLGKEIWILGSGPSLDSFTNDFFDDKLTIAINWSAIVFPNCTYWWGDAPALMFMKNYHPEVFRKTFLRFPFLFSATPKTDEKALEAILGKYRFDPICIRFKRSRNWSSFKKLATKAISIALHNQSFFFMTHWGTSLHQAILISAYLGASQITLAGCEARYVGGHAHAVRGDLKHFYCRASKHPWKKLRQGTKFLANLLGQYDIKLRHYFYDKGYMEI